MSTAAIASVGPPTTRYTNARDAKLDPRLRHQQLERERWIEAWRPRKLGSNTLVIASGCSLNVSLLWGTAVTRFFDSRVVERIDFRLLSMRLVVVLKVLPTNLGTVSDLSIPYSLVS